MVTGVACSVRWLLVTLLGLRCHHLIDLHQFRILRPLPLADGDSDSHASDSSEVPASDDVLGSGDAPGSDKVVESGVSLAGVADSPVLAMVASEVAPTPLQVPVLGSVPNAVPQAYPCLLTPH